MELTVYAIANRIRKSSVKDIFYEILDMYKYENVCGWCETFWFLDTYKSDFLLR